MKRMTSTIVVTGITATCFAPTAPGAGPENTNYKLKEGTTFQQGCFEACACPLTLPMDMTGTFVLTPIEQYPEYQLFEVSDVDWIVPALELNILGSGTLTIFTEFAVVHRLELDLQLGDAAVQHFDSGWTVGGQEFPEINISVNVNNLYCFDTLLTIAASPACMGDLDGDSAVNASDLAMLLGQWGTCDTCIADLTTDHGVDAADLAMLLGSWGECP